MRVFSNPVVIIDETMFNPDTPLSERPFFFFKKKKKSCLTANSSNMQYHEALPRYSYTNCI